MTQTETMKSILAGFIHDPPDNDFQKGYLAGMLVFANEVMDIRYDDPTWAAADKVSRGENPDVVAATTKAAAKRAPFTIIDGGKE